MVVARAWEDWGMKRYCLMGIKFLFFKMKKLWSCSHNKANMLNSTEHRNGSDDKFFVVCFFPTIKKVTKICVPILEHHQILTFYYTFFRLYPGAKGARQWCVGGDSCLHELFPSSEASAFLNFF